MPRCTVIYYLDVLSSWCLVAEEAWSRLCREFAGQIEAQWRIAALRDSFGYTPEQLAFYYRRTAAITGVSLNPLWLESETDGSRWANRAAEAARALGRIDDRVRLALARAAMIDGLHVSQRDVAVSIAAQAAGLKPEELSSAMDAPQTAAAIADSTAAFERLGVPVRPTFEFRNVVGDTTMLSGCWRYDALAAAANALTRDQSAFDLFMQANQAPAGVI
jgi:predicted DsbA family dithiol-disulfide isomerase